MESIKLEALRAYPIQYCNRVDKASKPATLGDFLDAVTTDNERHKARASGLAEARNAERDAAKRKALDKEYKDYRRDNVPAWAIATKASTERGTDAAPNGLLVLDLDHTDECTENIAVRIYQLPFVVWAAPSLSGRGVCAIAVLPPAVRGEAETKALARALVLRLRLWLAMLPEAIQLEAEQAGLANEEKFHVDHGAILNLKQVRYETFSAGFEPKKSVTPFTAGGDERAIYESELYKRAAELSQGRKPSLATLSIMACTYALASKSCVWERFWPGAAAYPLKCCADIVADTGAGKGAEMGIFERIWKELDFTVCNSGSTAELRREAAEAHFNNIAEPGKRPEWVPLPAVSVKPLLLVDAEASGKAKLSGADYMRDYSELHLTLCDPLARLASTKSTPLPRAAFTPSYSRVRFSQPQNADARLADDDRHGNGRRTLFAAIEPEPVAASIARTAADDAEFVGEILQWKAQAERQAIGEAAAESVARKIQGAADAFGLSQPGGFEQVTSISVTHKTIEPKLTEWDYADVLALLAELSPEERADARTHVASLAGIMAFSRKSQNIERADAFAAVSLYTESLKARRRYCASVSIQPLSPRQRAYSAMREWMSKGKANKRKASLIAYARNAGFDAGHITEFMADLTAPAGYDTAKHPLIRLATDEEREQRIEAEMSIGGYTSQPGRGGGQPQKGRGKLADCTQDEAEPRILEMMRAWETKHGPINDNPAMIEFRHYVEGETGGEGTPAYNAMIAILQTRAAGWDKNEARAARSTPIFTKAQPMQ